LIHYCLSFSGEKYFSYIQDSAGFSTNEALC